MRAGWWKLGAMRSDETGCARVVHAIAANGVCLLSGIHVQLRCGRLDWNEGVCSWSEVILRDATGGRYRTMRILDERLTFRLSFSICTIQPRPNTPQWM